MTAGADLLVLVTAIVALGVGAQVLADRYRVPSVLFLILAGIAIGPAGLGLVARDAFGDALTTVVGLSVAIIVFEGAFTLDVHRLREAPAVALRLVTVGAATAFVGTAVVVHVVLGAGWGVAALVAALLVATGPTVISPILAVVHVREDVATALETEGIVNDVTAAILAIAIFEAMTLEVAGPAAFAGAFLGRLALGVAIGAVVAGTLWALYHYPAHASRNAPQHARLLTLAGVVVAHGSAEAVTGEAGIAAAATTGLVLANADFPYRESIAEFKDDVTLLVLSFVFIALASLVDPATLVALGLPGLAVVVLVVAVVRPLVVAVSTVGTSVSWRERAFMSAVAPRGIVPASVATLFALRIQATDPRAATVLAGTVFLVILATVVFEAGPARHVADALGVSLPPVLVVGGGKLGVALAERYAAQGETVELVEADPAHLEVARAAGFSVHHGDGTDPEVLRAAGARGAARLVAATDDDDANLRIARLAREAFGVDSVVVRVNDPETRPEVEALDARPLATAQMEAWALVQLIDQEPPAWLEALVRGGSVQTVEVVTDRVVGQTVGDLEASLPPRCFLATVTRDGEGQVPPREYCIQAGDRLTFLGEAGAVAEAVARCRATD